MAGDGVRNVFDPTDILADIATLQDSVDDLDADVVLLQADVDAIAVLVEAEAILEETGGELTTDGTAQAVYVNDAPFGVYSPKWFTMDFANQTVTETVVIRTWYRIAPAGPWVMTDEETIVGAPVNPGIDIELHHTRYGIVITVTKTVGTNRAYDWTVFYEV